MACLDPVVRMLMLTLTGHGSRVQRLRGWRAGFGGEVRPRGVGKCVDLVDEALQQRWVSVVVVVVVVTGGSCKICEICGYASGRMETALACGGARNAVSLMGLHNFSITQRGEAEMFGSGGGRGSRRALPGAVAFPTGSRMA